MKKDVMKLCKCSICGTEAYSVPGTRHRRCSNKTPGLDADGKKKIYPIQTKNNKLKNQSRGIWAEMR